MVELIVAAVIGFTILLVIGAVCAGLSLIFLPFQILGWMLKGLGLVITIPLMLAFGLVGVLVFGVGVIFFLIPALPFALLVWLLWRVFRRPATPIST